MAPKLPSLKRIYRAAERERTLEGVTASKLRLLLKEREGWECADDEWKKGGLKQEAAAQWEELVNANADEDDEGSPSPKKKRKTSAVKKKKGDVSGAENEPAPAPKTKYDRAAERNFSRFVLDPEVMGGLGGAAAGDDSDGGISDFSPEPEPAPKELKKRRGKRPASDDEDDEDDEVSSRASGSDSGSGSPAPKTKGKKRASSTSSTSKKDGGGDKKKPRMRAPKGGFKSAEYIADSDDSSHDVEPRGSGEGTDEDGGGKKTKAKAKGKGKGKEGGKAKERKGPEPKEGDAPKGDEAEEDRIKRLKELLSAAAGPRAFTAATGAERTLSVERRTEVLEGLLKGLGLPVKNGKLPSMAKAREVGEKRNLAKEMEDLSGNPSTSGLRDGKHVHRGASVGGSDASGGSRDPSVSVVQERKKFAAFLGDQSSESD
ncbi:hypothetical protein DMC30DRAFT_414514 [Rhodotorula diobovata]|uniref:Proteophosphoglycan ppg4 n=1 Tax=Rhodotorula diobovata TaxID=5288 RepID=A0A5C5G1R6_9BASI|nr:hypothetical protein DMC30DRAFT_414514 [Rhodotorula diobovata]